MKFSDCVYCKLHSSKSCRFCEDGEQFDPIDTQPLNFDNDTILNPDDMDPEHDS